MVLRNILRHVQNALVLSSALLVILVLQRLVHYEHHEFVDVLAECDEEKFVLSVVS